MWIPRSHRTAGPPSATIPVPPRIDDLRINPSGKQQAWILSRARFNVVPAGRRSLKTEILKRKVVRHALAAGWMPAELGAQLGIRVATEEDPRYFLGAPTRDQAKDIFWQDVKRMIPRALMRRPPLETDLRIDCWTGAEIHIVGMDKPERIEGRPWNGGGLDEYGNMKPSAWPEHVYPALADRNGWCDLIGVPEGRNHYYDLYLKALTEMQALGDMSDWAVFAWPSSDILTAKQIQDARRDLDDLSFQQEYEASFVNFEGRAYYPFSDATHCATLVYNPNAPLILCFDFNVAPGVCAMVQEQPLPKQFEHDAKGAILLDRPIVGTGIIGEVHIPRNSNTPAVCRRIAQDWGKHAGPVHCYGDATGGLPASAKVLGSDWDLIEKELRPVFGGRLSFRVKNGNPPERARVNAMNSRLKTSIGDIRMMVDPAKAPNVVRDFEGVQLLKGGSGEIDKKINLKLTHLTDAIGYYAEYLFPIEGAGLQRMKISGV